eukprot:1890293-Rhodomonas_salina.1
MNLDSYIHDLEASAAPGYELASFAFSRCFEQVRLAVLRPSSLQKNTLLAWQIWDSCKSGSSRITLRIADLGGLGQLGNQFCSLVKDENWAARQGEMQLESGDHVLMPDDEVEGALALLPPPGAPERSACKCSCGKLRLFKGTPSSGSSFQCKDNDMEMEKSCQDPAIYNMVKEFGLEQYYQKEIDQKPLNLSFLFMLVQAGGSLEEVTKWNKLTEVAKLLGAAPENAADHALKVRATYESVFRTQKPQKDGGGSLEMILQQDTDVIKTLQKKGSKLRTLIGLTKSDKHRMLRMEGQYLPSIFRGVTSTPRRSEQVIKTMKEVWEAATQWANYAEQRGDRCPKWAGAVNEIVDLSRKVWCMDAGNDDMALVMLGMNGAGKSFLMDCILRMSEGDRSRYADDTDPQGGEKTGRLEAQEYLDSLNKASPGDGSDDAGVTPGHSEPVIEIDAKLLRYFCSAEVSDVLQREHEAAAQIANFCMTNTLDGFPSFIFPLIRPSDSTTACAISARRGRRFQLVLEYFSRNEVLPEWQLYKALKKSSKDSAKTNREFIEKQVMEAMGLSKVFDAQQFLDKFDPDMGPEMIRTAMPEFDSVLGKRVGFAGAGLSAVEDRILIRAILNNAQGIKDEFTHAIVLPSGETTGHTMLSGDGESRTAFGRRTYVALKKIVLFAPCDILPVTESEWVDLPGGGDSDPIKQRNLRQKLSRAEAVMAVVDRSLEAATSTVTDLQNSTAFSELINAVRDGKEDDTRVSIIQNLEKTMLLKGVKVTPDWLESHSMTGEYDSGEKNREKLRRVVADSVGCPELDAKVLKALGDQVCEQVPNIISAFKFATSVVMNTDPDCLPEATRQKWLEITNIYELLGVVEKFLRTGTRRMIEGFKEQFDFQLEQLKTLREGLGERVVGRKTGKK